MAEQNRLDSQVGKTARRFAVLAFSTAGLTYALIVFGGIVRITGSGMGCGDDWPLCNGQLVPPMDFETLIEYGHRLAAVLVGFLVLAVAVYGVRRRRTPGLAGRNVSWLGVAAAALLIVQVFVGAITVRLELPAGTVVLHLAIASALLAVLLIAGLRALTEAPAVRDTSTTYPRWALASAVLGFVALLFGGLVANTGAAPLCQGFPLCNGQLFPEGGALVQLHWTHRLIAYALVLIVVIAAAKTQRQDAPSTIWRSALVGLILVLAQVIVAAVMMLTRLPPELRALHLAVSTALWASLVVWTTLATGQPAWARTTRGTHPI